MVIIKHGTAYNESDSYSCKCPKCDCEFEYVKRDVHSYLNEECYVICPECFSDIKLPKWLVTYADGSEEEFSEDNTLELVCASLGDRKLVIKIERIIN